MTTKRVCEYVMIGGPRKGTKCGSIPRGGRASCSLHAPWMHDYTSSGGDWWRSDLELRLYDMVEEIMRETGYETPEAHPTEEVMRRRFEEVQSEWENSETESFEREVSWIELEVRGAKAAEAVRDA